MVNEVESILNEIRERVRSEQEPAPIGIIEISQPALGNSNEAGDLANSESLSRLSAHLTTTTRAWDRLPPLYSNRKGGAARLELWIKARLKSFSRWFTWEQVNFNAAVHHALSETLQALAEHQQELAAIRNAFRAEAANRREEFERSDRELAALRVRIESLANQIRQRDIDLDALAVRVDTVETTNAGAAESAVLTARRIDEASAELTSQLAGLAAELRESDQKLREEHRVCFKQLSLEASETAVSSDRARRIIATRMDQLEAAIANDAE
jgi:hypothetical protein